MGKIAETILPAEGGIILIFFAAVFLTSFNEREYRAASVAIAGGILLSLPYLFPGQVLRPFIQRPFDPVYPGGISAILVFLPPLLVLALFLPYRGKIDYTPAFPSARFDERDTMFSRNSLMPGTEKYREYYGRHPEKESCDLRFRQKPGLLKAGTKYYDPILFAAAASMFDRVAAELHPSVEGDPEGARARAPEGFQAESPERGRAGPDEIGQGPSDSWQRPSKIGQGPSDSGRDELTWRLLKMARDMGAHSAGVAGLRDYHVYSAGGRGDRYGVPYGVDHKYALVFTVEMDYDMMQTAPAAPTVVESARQYLRSGMIAVQLAGFIRSLGYAARAHIDGNYRVICPLLARDAGLGDIGRMGILMTPRIGPRCRIAAVTTDLPLSSFSLGVHAESRREERLEERREERPGGGTGISAGKAVGARQSRRSLRNASALIDFCRHCEKCALACPGHAIPSGGENVSGGVRRWQVDHESCYAYWCQAGTDCGRCMIVCPFAHPDNWFHGLVRFGIRNNLLFRRLALPLDNLFYGRKPSPRRSV